ncbi:MAG: lysophospholipid acyltransferase family protein [Desulfobacterales bacterium]|nr:MAG: lysophospholipid acyltransferase family protein [Desulfobacterales bacterium]
MQPNERQGPERPRTWTSRSIGSRFQHEIFYRLIRIGGRRLAYFMLHPVVSYYVLCRPSVRRKTHYYLRRRFPDGKSSARWVDSYRMLLKLGQVLADRASVGILGPREMRVELSGREKLLQLLGERRGLILLLSHAGSWQVALSALGFLNLPVNLLLDREPGDIDRQYFEHAGRSCPYRVIDPQGYLGGTLEMLQVLKKGEVLCLMGDRVFGSNRSYVKIDFLGAQAPFPISAFKLASAASVPVAVLFSYKTGIDRYELKIARIIRVPENLGRSGDAFRPYVSQFAAELEAFVQEHPYQFFNFYNMWQAHPASA